MKQLLTLHCQCGQLRGVVSHVMPGAGNRVVCYCDDCQAYLHWLKRTELLDGSGGTRVVQVPPAYVQLTQGVDAIRCVRLTAKGLYRWYAGCCHWPLGNTMGPGVPIIGLHEAAFDRGLSASDRDTVLGLTTARIFGKYAVGGLPEGAEEKVSLRTIAGIAGKLLSWWVRGLATPTPVFIDKRPLAIPEVLTSLEREELGQRVAQR